jgi:hypothetical protein
MFSKMFLPNLIESSNIWISSSITKSLMLLETCVPTFFIVIPTWACSRAKVSPMLSADRQVILPIWRSCRAKLYLEVTLHFATILMLSMKFLNSDLSLFSYLRLAFTSSLVPCFLLQLRRSSDLSYSYIFRSRTSASIMPF